MKRMKKLFVLSMIIFAALGCAVIPEEWMPLVGEWDILLSSEYGVFSDRLYYNSYKQINFTDGGSCYGLYGEERGEHNDYLYYCVLTEDNPEAKYSPDEYRYFAVTYAYNREMGEEVWAHFYYFNMVDDNNIEGVYMDVSFVLPGLNDWEYRPFSGTKN